MSVLYVVYSVAAVLYRAMCYLQRKQKEVEKANNFYYQLLQKALPCDEDAMNDKPKRMYCPVFFVPIRSFCMFTYF